MLFVRSSHDIEGVRVALIEALASEECKDPGVRSMTLVRGTEPLFMSAGLAQAHDDHKTEERMLAGLAGLAREFAPEPSGAMRGWEESRLRVYAQWAECRLHGDLPGALAVARESVRLAARCIELFPSQQIFAALRDHAVLIQCEALLGLCRYDEALAALSAVSAGGNPAPSLSEPDRFVRALWRFHALAGLVRVAHWNGESRRDDDARRATTELADEARRCEHFKVLSRKFLGALVSSVGLARSLGLPEVHALIEALGDVMPASLREVDGDFTEKSRAFLAMFCEHEPADDSEAIAAAMHSAMWGAINASGSQQMLVLDTVMLRAVSAFDEEPNAYRAYLWYFCAELVRAGASPLDVVERMLDERTEGAALSELMPGALSTMVARSEVAFRRLASSEQARRWLSEKFTMHAHNEGFCTLKLLAGVVPEETITVLDVHGLRGFRVRARNVTCGQDLNVLLSTVILGPERDGLIPEKPPSLDFLREFYGEQTKPTTQVYRRRLGLYQPSIVKKGKRLDPVHPGDARLCLDNDLAIGAWHYLDKELIDGERALVIATDLEFFYRVAQPYFQEIKATRFLPQIKPSIELIEVLPRARAAALIERLGG